MKRKDRKPHFAYDPINMQNFYYCPGFTSEQISKAIKINFDIEHKEELSTKIGNCLYVQNEKNAGIFIWIKDYKDFSSFVHEVVHATAFALCNRGYEFNENQEAFSYQAGFLTKSFWGKK